MKSKKINRSKLSPSVSTLEREEAIYEIAKIINSLLDPKDLLEKILDLAIETLEAERGVLFLVDPKTGKLEIKASHNMSEQAIEEAVRIGDSVLREARRGGVALISERSQSGKEKRKPQLFSLLCLPLKLKERISGCIYIDSKASRKTFQASDLEFAEAFTNLAAISIDNAQLFHREQSKVTRLSLVNEVGREISSVLKIEEVLQRAARQIVESLGYYFVNILLLDSEKKELVHRMNFGYPERPLKGLRLKMGGPGITSWAALKGEPLLINDVQKDPRFIYVEELRHTKSELAIPIKLKGDVIGVMDVESDQVDAFDETDLSVLQTISDQLAVAIENARLHQRLHTENIQLKQEIRGKYQYENFVGSSRAMETVFKMIQSASRTTSNVLILGESGTGKEMVAKAIHYSSDRREKRFVPVDCGALHSQLLESELFGHKKGAFTGAISDKPGLFEEANGGTIFLDEITNMSESLQARLLRVIQEGEIRRLGETTEREVNVRIIAATNQDPGEEMEKGHLREDLYFRLNVITIPLPILSRRIEDIPLLASFFLNKYNEVLKRQRSGFSEETLSALSQYDWPGNVRELENEIERIIAMGSERGLIQVTEIAERIRTGLNVGAGFKPARTPHSRGSLKDEKEKVEKERILGVLEAEDWKIERAARRLNISRQWLRKRMNRYGLRQSHHRDAEGAEKT
jgi:Nif-specific regulatory protein